MKTVISALLGFLIKTFAFASDFKLPPNLEIVYSDSISITIRNKETGITGRLLLDGKPLSRIRQDDRPRLENPYLTYDTCFAFTMVGHEGPIGHDDFGDAGHKGRPEIAGTGTSWSWINEYSSHDTTFIFGDAIYDALPIDYGRIRMEIAS